MKKAVCFLSILTLILGRVAVALWLLPISGYKRDVIKNGYGMYEGLELVTVTDRYGNRIHCVTDSAGRKLFDITVRNCTLDTRFQERQTAFQNERNGT